MTHANAPRMGHRAHRNATACHCPLVRDMVPLDVKQVGRIPDGGMAHPQPRQ